MATADSMAIDTPAARPDWRALARRSWRARLGSQSALLAKQSLLDDIRPLEPAIAGRHRCGPPSVFGEPFVRVGVAQPKQRNAVVGHGRQVVAAGRGDER